MQILILFLIENIYKKNLVNLNSQGFFYKYFTYNTGQQPNTTPL